MCCALKRFLYLFGILLLLSLARGQENQLSCGRRKVKSVYLTHNGIDAKAGYWPWHAVIFHRKGEQNEYACGGSIIDESTILTAAHCVYGQTRVLPAGNVTVHVGRIHMKEATEFTQVYEARALIPHPGFSSRSTMHDIALIKLSSHIKMTMYVQPGCLWTMDSNQELIVGRNGTIVGFGLTEQDVVLAQLKQALVGVADTMTCIQRDRAVFGTRLRPEIFCGKGQPGVSVCIGDSGGGMFFEIGGKWYIRGLVSFTPSRSGNRLCDPLKYTAYTDVAKYLDWIRPYIDQRVLPHESDIFNIDYQEKLQLFDFKTCGIKSSVYVNNGTRWTLPWLGFVRTVKEKKLKCIVTLISDWYAVGPAHCFENDGVEALVIFGDVSEHPKAECLERNGTTICPYASQTHRIDRVIVNPRFDRKSYANNIALIELLTPVDTNQPNVKPICVSVVSVLRTNSKTHLHVATRDDGNSYKNIPVRYVESLACRKQYAQGNVMLNLENNTLCAKITTSADDHYCNVDKPGSPLQEIKRFNETERYFLRGFDLLGLACMKQFPSVYINAEAYLDWILYEMSYNRSEVEVLGKSTVNQTLELEWSALQQQSGKNNLRLFDMSSCGLNSAFRGNQDNVPWLGILHIGSNDNEAEYNLVVLISEWYALASKRSIQNDFLWRYVILGEYRKNSPTNYDGLEMHDESYQKIEIKNIITPSSDQPSQKFALIELIQPGNTKLNSNIRPICLPFLERLHQHKPTAVIMSSSSSIYGNTISKNLTLIDHVNCQQRLPLGTHFVALPENASCATDTDKLRQTPLSSKLGSSFQRAVWFGGHTRYFLHGMTTNEPNLLADLKYGPYLYETVELADLAWIVENMQEKVLKSSFLSTTKNEQVNLLPINVPSSKRTLFNFNTCGTSSSTYPTPWMGVSFTRTGKCSVTLISELYVVGSAHCLGNATQEIVTELGYTFGGIGSVECSEHNMIVPCVQRIATKKIFVHPLYDKTSHINDIALLQLATPANTSLPNLKPICLPIIDTIRSYNISSLAFVTKKFYFSQINIADVENRYFDTVECRKRWQGLKVNYTIDMKNHCVINQRTPADECVDMFRGGSLHSRQRLGSSERNFLRGFAVNRLILCSLYYPVIHINTDAYIEWILSTMEKQSSQPFDRRRHHIFIDK